MTFISGLICPRDHQKAAFNGGLLLTAGPLTQVNSVLKKPMKILDLSNLTVIGGSPLMPGPREPGLYCMSNRLEMTIKMISLLQFENSKKSIFFRL